MIRQSDEGMGPLAAQPAWLLAYYGHPEVRVLDGEWPAWEAIDGPVSDQAVRPEPTTYFAQPDGTQLATANWIAAHLAHPDILTKLTIDFWRNSWYNADLRGGDRFPQPFTSTLHHLLETLTTTVRPVPVQV